MEKYFIWQKGKEKKQQQNNLRAKIVRVFVSTETHPLYNHRCRLDNKKGNWHKYSDCMENVNPQTQSCDASSSSSYIHYKYRFWREKYYAL